MRPPTPISFKRTREVCGLRLDESTSTLVRAVWRTLREHFGPAVADDGVEQAHDEPLPYARAKFTIYDSFEVVFEYDRGGAGFGIVTGGRVVRTGVKAARHGVPDEQTLATALQELEAGVRLRIPEQHLAAQPWHAVQ